MDGAPNGVDPEGYILGVALCVADGALYMIGYVAEPEAYVTGEELNGTFVPPKDAGTVPRAVVCPGAETNDRELLGVAATLAVAIGRPRAEGMAEEKELVGPETARAAGAGEAATVFA